MVFKRVIVLLIVLMVLSCNAYAGLGIKKTRSWYGKMTSVAYGMLEEYSKKRDEFSKSLPKGHKYTGQEVFVGFARTMMKDYPGTTFYSSGTWKWVFNEKGDYVERVNGRLKSLGFYRDKYLVRIDFSEREFWVIAPDGKALAGTIPKRSKSFHHFGVNSKKEFESTIDWFEDDYIRASEINLKWKNDPKEALFKTLDEIYYQYYEPEGARMDVFLYQFVSDRNFAEKVFTDAEKLFYSDITKPKKLPSFPKVK